MSVPEYLSLKATRAALQLSENTLRKLFDTRVLGGFLTEGGHRKFLRADVLSYKKRREKTKIPSGYINFP